MIESYDPQILSEIIPTAIRGELERKMRSAVHFARALDPAMREADAELNRAQYQVEPELRASYPSRLPPPEVLRASEARLRALLDQADARADLIIKNAADAIRRAPRWLPAIETTARATTADVLRTMATTARPTVYVMIRPEITTPHEYQ
jgi:hypothetical protein